MVRLVEEAGLRHILTLRTKLHMKTLASVRSQMAAVMDVDGALRARSLWRRTFRAAQCLVLGPRAARGRRDERHGLPLPRSRLVRCLTPPDKSGQLSSSRRPFRPSLALLKWGQPAWRAKRLARAVWSRLHAKTPAEDFATGMVTYKNPESGRLAKAQFSVSWMYDKQGLRLSLDGLGAGYAFEMNTRARSPLELVHRRQGRPEGVADAESVPCKNRPPAAVCSPSNRTKPICTPIPMRTQTIARPSRDQAGRRFPLDLALRASKLCGSRWPPICSAERRRATVDLTDPKISSRA